ncbi:putative LRR receptor-like serine/threonine-protein kinase RFK1 [Glycine max]|nr:putative LRR receptor-like serine/threonine-protein kinase RFK1 [Glycine max]
MHGQEYQQVWSEGDSHCFHVNCGGKNVKVMENDENIHYVGDGEIQFSNDNTFGSLGKRLFDIYVQNILEIQFYWAGKGTTRIPVGGVYGPLISAFSIVSDSKPCSDQKNARHKIIVGVGFGVTALCLVLKDKIHRRGHLR